LRHFACNAERATNPAQKIDELGVQMFCIVVKSNAQLVHKAQEMIVAKVRSTNVTEATRAISVNGYILHFSPHFFASNPHIPLSHYHPQPLNGKGVCVGYTHAAAQWAKSAHIRTHFYGCV